MTAKINPQAALETVCFTMFAGLLFYLVGSGKYLNYVTPKMAPYLCFTAVVMLIWVGSRFRQIFRPQYKTRAAHCFVLVIPVLLLLLPLGTISSSSLSSGYSATLNGTGGTSPAALPQTADSENSSASEGSSSQSASSQANPSSSGSSAASSTGEGDGTSGDSLLKQYGLSLSKDGSIEVSDEQFYPWLSEIYSNMDQYEGTVITVKGFVYEDLGTMGKNQFVPARMLMYCCAADLVPCGILCEYDKLSELKIGAWVTVTGTIHIKDEQGERQPIVTVTGISPAKQPNEAYVYPW